MEKYQITLQDAFKRYTLDQDKVISPEKTVKHFKEKLQSVNLDILEDTIRIDNGRLDIPVYFSTCGRDARNIIGTKKQMGKGATPTQSEASAVMELAERFSFFSYCKNPANFMHNTYDALKDQAIAFDQIAQSVHDTSEDLDAARKIFENLPLKWAWAYNLSRNESVLIPFNWFFAINEFNGPSAGNCVEEALSQGICEIIERHVCSVISHNQIQTPAIDPSTATDSMVQEMLHKYNRAGVKIHVSDFTLEMGIPSVGVIAYDPSTFPAKSEIVWTAGTTPSPEKALSRALTEVAQLAGDFNSGSNYVASGLPKFRDLDQASYALQPTEAVDLGALPDLSDNNIKIEVENMIDVLATKGMEVIVVDTTHSRLQIPAFYTIIPGAHFRERALETSIGMFAAKLIKETQSVDDAIAQLMEMDRILSGKYYVHFYLGSCFLDKNDSVTALKYFEQALQLDPNDQDIPTIYSYMGVCLKNMGQYRQALDVLAKGENLDKERTDIYNLMGFCHFKLKEHEKAIACFKEVLQLDPSSAIDYANIASNYRNLGEKEKAIHYYQMALALDSSIDFARENLEKLLS
ncbi:MAG: YcaO-like family protein [Desulfobacterales bacterium]|nr:YcaO-like family protein [Desulfobacterales bacterium]